MSNSVSDCDAIANVQSVFVCNVKQAPVLNVGVATDVYAIDIRTYNSVKPDAGTFRDVRAPDDHGRGSNEDALVNVWLKIFKREKHA